jgi:hypothetical protein
MDSLSRLDTGRFYVENVRSVLGVSHGAAQRICDTAVRQGLFERVIGIERPDGSIAATATAEADLPTSVRCAVQVGDFLEEVEYQTSELPKLTFYRLHEESPADNEATRAHARTA